LSAGAPPQTQLGELTALPQTPSLDFRGLLRRRGEGRERKGGEARKGQEGREKEEEKDRVKVGEGRGGGRVDPQAKAWPPELFSWRRRCGKRILDFLLVLIELR